MASSAAESAPGSPATREPGDGAASEPVGDAERDELRWARTLNRSQLVILQVSVLIVALCGIAYELVIATVSSYLLGNSVYQFSITIGLFMFAMGLGSFISKWLGRSLLQRFVTVELLVSLFGGLSSVLLFLMFPYYSLYRPTMYLLIVVIGALVGLEIPLLMRVLSAHAGVRRSIADVLSLDYIGALIGSVSFPLVMLPSLGLFRSSFAFGTLNLLVGLVNVLVFRKQLRHAGSMLVACALTGALMVGGVLGASELRHFAEGQLYADEILHMEQTPYQRIVVTEEVQTRKIRMYLDGHLQFAELDEYRYHEALVHPALSPSGSRDKVLILGGGDGLVAREVLKYDDVAHIDLVDIDPAVTELVRRIPRLSELNQGSLEDPRVHVHNEDGFNWVRERRGVYDRVVIDFPDPHNEVISKLYSVEFYRLLKRALKPGGLVVTQSASPFITREAFWCIERTLREAGFDTHPYQAFLTSFGQWGFTLARAQADGRVPRDFSFDVPLRFLTADVMRAAAVFGSDTSILAGPVNSLFEPKLYELYQLGQQR